MEDHIGSNICLVLLQYNCISLGFTMAAVAASLSQRDPVASVLYCLALNHKQVLSGLAVALYYYSAILFPFIQRIYLLLIKCGAYCIHVLLIVLSL